VIETAPATAPAPAVRGVAARSFTKDAAADWVFVGVVVLTAWWYLRVSRGHSFLRDDWQVAERSLSFGDLFEPYNGHLSVVPLAIYRVMLGEFGMETYTPERLLGSTSLLGLGVALFLFARSRVGAPVALVVAVSVLWLPTTNLTPFLSNFHFALVGAVVCAAALPSRDRRSDVVVSLALAFSFLNSGVAVAVAAACAAHALMDRARLSRWVAIAVPSLLWVWWWLALGQQPRAPGSPSIGEGLGDVVEGAFGSFSALTWDWPVGGAVLLAGWVALLVHRVRTDRASSLTQLAWAGGLVVWWAGLVWSRSGAAVGYNGRYDYVGAVFILLSVLPVERADWLTSPKARSVLAAPALAIVAAIVLVNHDELRDAVQRRAYRADTVEIALYELEAAVGPVDPTRRLTSEMAGITVGDYQEKVVPRYGSPIDLSEPPDEAMIERGVLPAPVVGPAPADDPGCASGPVNLYFGGEVALHTGDQPATVRARRFGSSMVDLRQVRAGRSVVVRFPVPTIFPFTPWVIDAPGACIHAEPAG
jgi:hypothetical protein